VARIVTNLLELARPSGFERQVLDLAQVARDEVVQLRAEAEQSGVILEFSAGGEVNTAGNRVQMELVVNNLVRNALQATPKGGRVEVVVAAEPALAVIEVRDSGAGIPEDVRASVFEPFVTTRQGRGGTGVGLAISRDIVRAHGGDIRILAGRAGGTVMRVELPSLEEGA
ncbi:MAG: HAMP domain-containing histidine kinase, partial [Acidobacteria bacterium]|nr:HAMP domain-containing histidine kinase [Acidobacteriota bacterium]